jgi:hypothetical protein
MAEETHAESSTRKKGEATNCEPADRSWMNQCWQQMATFMLSEWSQAEHRDRGSVAQAGCCPRTSSHEDQRNEQSMEVSR